MSYRLQTHVKPLIWVRAMVEPHSNSRIEYMVKAKSQFKRQSVANGVEIRIPVPSDVSSPSFKASIGTVVYVPDCNCVVWSIKQFFGSREYLMRAHFGLPSIRAEETEEEEWKGPIQVKSEIPYFTVSGIQVRYLKIIEKTGYQALPWVRYITQNGKVSFYEGGEGGRSPVALLLHSSSLHARCPAHRESTSPHPLPLSRSTSFGCRADHQREKAYTTVRRARIKYIT